MSSDMKQPTENSTVDFKKLLGDDKAERLQSNPQAIAQNLVTRIKQYGAEGTRLQGLIDTSKTDLKRLYYKKKLSKNADKQIKLIEALYFLDPTLAEAGDER